MGLERVQGVADGAGNGEQARFGLSGRDRLAAFAFAAADLLVEVDAAGVITFAAGAFPSRFGCSPTEALGRPIAHFIAAEDHLALEAGLSALAARGRLKPTVLRLNDAERSAVSCAGLAIAEMAGRFCLVFGPVPLAPQRSAGAEAEGGFLRMAEARLRSSGGEAAKLALFEVEGLAEATAMLGRDAREGLLDSISRTLGEQAPAGAAAEFGGGRWAVLHAGKADAAAMARAVEAAVRERAPAAAAPRVRGSDLVLAAPGFSTAQQVRALRLALDAFAAGGKRGLDTSGFGRGLEGFLHTLSERAEGLRARIRRRGFRLLFQPVVELAGRQTHHFEALIRPTPAADGQPEAPQTFVTLVEAAGLSAELDLAVAALARDSVTASRASLVAVKVSALSLGDASFRSSLAATLDAVPELQQRLMFEIAEPAEIADAEVLRAAVDLLRTRGFLVALDDVGSAAASLRWLRAVRFDFAKIDGALIRAAVTAERDRDVLAQTIDLCRQTGAAVIAERIETEEDARLVRELGATHGQGHLFGKPGHLPGLVGR
ncbi:sensor domain-containing phosphodiesterase [Elioraea thermophila]|uniref:sensor domain-containing phosphodiesterase n=1 Tax=Elioraea thermophila TaxID=2185104 RepID=UPI000DF21B27|nr:EAL domain-containing protein [Elioraea thermophila]